jgi:hypothetical protein
VPGRWYTPVIPVLGRLRWEDQASLGYIGRTWLKEKANIVTHAYNPSYSGGRDQVDLGSKSAWANRSHDPISKKHITKKGWWSGSR